MPTFVLVHGGWGGAWNWRDLVAEFEHRGASWRALDLPSSHDPAGVADLQADAAIVCEVATMSEPVVLVGHSYGGCVVTEAASRVVNLVGVVYVAALVPAVGESALNAVRRTKVRTELDDAIITDEPFLNLDPGRAGSALYGECTLANQAWAVDQLGSQTIASFRSPRQSPDASAARRYVRCAHDRAIDPSLQALMGAACDDVIELSSDHSPFLSHPIELADLILDWPN